MRSNYHWNVRGRVLLYVTENIPRRCFTDDYNLNSFKSTRIDYYRTYPHHIHLPLPLPQSSRQQAHLPTLYFELNLLPELAVQLFFFNCTSLGLVMSSEINFCYCGIVVRNGNLKEILSIDCVTDCKLQSETISSSYSSKNRSRTCLYLCYTNKY